VLLDGATTSAGPAIGRLESSKKLEKGVETARNGIESDYLSWFSLLSGKK
jgi:hypothetical protein